MLAVVWTQVLAAWLSLQAFHNIDVCFFIRIVFAALNLLFQEKTEPFLKDLLRWCTWLVQGQDDLSFVDHKVLLINYNCRIFSPLSYNIMQSRELSSIIFMNLTHIKGESIIQYICINEWGPWGSFRILQTTTAK